MNALRIALAQFNAHVGHIDANADQIIALARVAHRQHQADVVVFPELALTGYPPEDLLLRPDFYARVESALDRIRATSSDDIHLIIGHPRRVDGNTFNACSVLYDRQVLAVYDKQLLPNYSVFDEKRYFQPGTAATVIGIKGIQLGLTICEDIWEPEPARQACAAGAQVIININASPFHIGKDRERLANLQQRASETRCPIAYVNLVGGQDELVFDGNSMLIDGAGTLVARAASFAPALLVTEVTATENGLAVSGERAESIPELASIYAALVLGVRDYIEKNSFSGAILGLSGGIDSALTLTIAVDAIGAETVEAVLMPSQFTADMSIDDALKEAATLGVNHHTLPIQPVYEAFMQTLSKPFDGRAADTTEENLQARCRGVLLMALSNKSGKILLTTSNKSETAVGYSTLYGDMAGGFAPLKDVAKTLVYKLANWRNEQGPVIPQRVIDRPPSAELAPDQKDTDSLPEYSELDAILERYVEDDQSPAEIIAGGFAADTVKRVTQLVDRNEYKRRQSAPGVRITQRAFGRDRRYPITSGHSGTTD